jgi:hypothetical protein
VGHRDLAGTDAQGFVGGADHWCLWSACFCITLLTGMG